MISNQDLYNRSIKNNLEQTLSNNLYNHAHHYDQPQHYYDQLYHQQQYHYEYQQQQQQQQYHHLIDTASHQSFTYGRQPRQDSRQLPPLPPSLPSPNPISRLASALQSNQQQAPGLVGAKPKRVCHHRTWKKKIQLIYDYKHAHFISFLLFLILILVLIVIFIFQGFKFAMLTANHHQASRSSMIPLVQVNHQPESPDWENYQKWDATTPSPTSDSSSLSPDVLSSKLLIGEFVILSQNYTNSATRKSVLAENIVKLMDQVFLSTDMRRLYSRMNVLDIRPHVPSGIIVKCNIILSESIIYAAQQFGFALYDSLARSNEKLANQPGFIIDKNSIRFNSVRYAAANQAHNHQPFSRHTVATTRPTTTSRLINLPLFSLSLYRKPSSTHSPTAIPDKDLSMLPNRLLPEILAPSIPQPIVTPPSDGDDLKSSPASAAQPSDSPQHDQDVIGWSEWSAWSSCVDKNGICDSTRLHSRIRMCVMKDSGVQIDSSLCRQRFSVQDLELEVTDCSSTCANSAMGSPQSFQSDAPLVITPNTAPSIMLAGPSSSETPSSTSRAIKQQQLQENNNNNANHALAQGMGGLFGNDPTGTSSNSNTMDNIYAGGQDDSDRPVNYGGRQQNSGATAVAGQLASLPLNSPPSIGSQENGSSPPAVMVPGPTPTTSSLPTVIQLDSQQQQMSCSNCTSDEICLLLVSQKVPFCAKIKDRQDLSGCGGWCKADDQICQPVGQNAFKCSHNSECLPGEWRCHDSQCIPASKRCDGHENCFDSSDERYCPSAAA